MSFKPILLVVFCGVAQLFAFTAHSFDNKFDFETLTRLIENQKIESIEGLLLLLPSELRSHYALLHSSRSGQTATSRYPRVVLHSESADIILAFAGASRGKLDNHLEIIEFDRTVASYKFREIIFGDHSLSSSETSGVKIVHNPVRCFACHGLDPKPIWESYNTWPGAYGSQHTANPLSKEEQISLEDFIRNAGRSPRHSFLKNLRRTTLRELSRANGELTKSISRQNSLRILAKLKTQLSQKPEYKMALFAALVDSDLFFDCLPGGDTSASRHRYEVFWDMTADALSRTFQDKRRRFKELMGTDFIHDLDADDIERITKIRMVAEDGLGVSINDWATTRYEGELQFMTGVFGTFYEMTFDLVDVLKTDPEFAKIFSDMKIERSYFMRDFTWANAVLERHLHKKQCLDVLLGASVILPKIPPSSDHQRDQHP